MTCGYFMGRIPLSDETLGNLECPSPENQPNQVYQSDFKEGDRLPTNLVCEDDRPTNDRIVGGQEAVKNSWPWMVQLQYMGYTSCGGTIIGDNVILTAAHCCQAYQDHRLVTALVGQHSYSERNPDPNLWWFADLDQGAQKYQIEKKIRHPLFNWKADNDICLLFTRGKLQYFRFIRNHYL